jgi:long-chain-fatty-acid--CoA ligase ACSBG
MDMLNTEITLTQIIIFILICLIIGVIYIFCMESEEKKVSSKINIMADFVENEKFKNFTIVDYLKVIAKEYPRKTALKIKDGKEGNKIKWKSVDYITYYKNVVGFAQSLNYWLGTNVNVAILGFNSPGWFYSHLGCMLNGGTPIGLYPTSTKEMCKQILDDSGAKVLVVEDDIQLQKFIGMKIPNIQLIIYYSPISDKMVDKFSMPVLSMGNFMSEKNNLLFPKIKLDNVATLIYTSGTTGTPKGVKITHKNIMTSIRRILLLIQTKSSIDNLVQEDFLSYLPLNHITAQFMDIYIPIITLGKVWFADKNALKTSLVDTLQQVKPTCFVGVPRVWEKIHEQINEGIKKEGIKGQVIYNFMPKKILEKVGLDKCKYVLSVGAPLLPSTLDFFETIGLQINDNYGLSETCGPISVTLPNFSKPGSVGYPIMGVKIEKDGEILVKGDNLFIGYHNNKKEDIQVFTKDGWFKTGDIGLLDSDGFLYVTGRKKDIIITAGGENIPPIPIENELSQHLKCYFDNIIVIGDKLKFLSVLLTSPKKLPPDINKIIETAINETNKSAQSNAHTIKKFLIINDKFTVGNELTPTMKIKRQFVQKKYNSRIMKLYT